MPEASVSVVDAAPNIVPLYAGQAVPGTTYNMGDGTRARFVRVSEDSKLHVFENAEGRPVLKSFNAVIYEVAPSTPVEAPRVAPVEAPRPPPVAAPTPVQVGRGPRVSHLRANVKVLIDLALSAKVLVVGNNTKGKTALSQAYRLALTARADDLGASGVELMQLASDGADKLYAEAELSNGARASFVVEGSTAKASRPRHETMGLAADQEPGAVINQIVTDMLRGGAKAQREAFLLAAAPKDVLKVARSSVPEAYRKAWDKAVEAARKELAEDGIGAPPEADVLVTIAESLRKEKKAVAKTAKAELGPRPEAPTAPEVEKWAKSIERGRSLLAARNNYLAAFVRMGALRTELHAADTRGVVAGAPSLAARERLKKRAAALKSLIESADDSTGDSCPACGAAGGHVRAVTFTDLAAAATVSAENAAKAAEARTGAGRASSVIAADIAAAESMALQIRSTLPESLDPNDAAVWDTVSALVEETLAKHEDAAKQIAAAEAWDTARAASIEAEGRTIELEALIKASQRAVTDVLGAAIKAFADRASAALPSGAKLGLELFDGHRAICRVGLVDKSGDVRSWKALSGAERALCLGAVAAAWAPSVNAAARAVVIDDIWLGDLGPPLLAGLGRAVDTAGADGLSQVIVSVVEASEALLAAAEHNGYQVIRL